MVIDTKKIEGWAKARKTKPILARPIESLLNDQNMNSQLVLKTIEGYQDLKPQSLVCIGASNDAWQQTEKALLKKYDLTGFREGWMVMTPKPENEALAFQITEELCEEGVFQIHGLWGKPDEKGNYLQDGKAGDYVLHNPSDENDYWIVNQRMFENTYELFAAERNITTRSETTASA